MERQTDALVIGGGPGGYVSAIRLGQLGKKVVLVEKAEIGGTCLNRGCIPTKALIYVGKVIREATHGERMGIKAEVSVDFSRTQAWNRLNVDKRRRGTEYILRANGVELVRGEASLESPNTAVVKPQGDRIKAQVIIIATGSRPSDLPTVRVDSRLILSSDDIFQLNEIPKKMVIVGGGAIGVEMATAFAPLGTKVAIVEMMDQILPGLSQDLITPVIDALRKLGVEIYLKTKVIETKHINSESSERVQLRLESGVLLDADHVLVAVGRKPNTDSLNLMKAGVEVDQKGFIRVNDRLETSAGAIFAVGDVTGLPYLAHRAMEQGFCAAEIAAGIRDTYSQLPMPSVIYSDPEIAFVGMSEAEASSKGIDTLVGKFPFIASGRAQTMGRMDGFAKVIGDKEDGRIIGVQMVGPSVSELIGECSTLMANCSTLEELASGVHPHPTLSEVLSEAAKLALGKPLHYEAQPEVKQ